VGIATTVTEPVLFTVLFTAGAVIAIGVGGGLIKPMQERWERMLSAAERETNTQIASYQQGRSDAMRAPQPARDAQTAQQPTYSGGQGQQGVPGSGPGYQQGPQGSGSPQGTDPGDWRDPGTSYR
jgi:hypothetical protein